MFALSACVRFQVTPKVSHLQAVKRIFRYLKGKPYSGLWYPKESPFDLLAFSDSDYAGASLDRKSTTRGNDDNAAEEPITTVEDRSTQSPTPFSTPPQQPQDIPSTSQAQSPLTLQQSPTSVQP
nr:uncharacterized mitochondrial protein AtMg00810-like [Tanacetum cinerariifolium]